MKKKWKLLVLSVVIVAIVASLAGVALAGGSSSANGGGGWGHGQNEAAVEGTVSSGHGNLPSESDEVSSERGNGFAGSGNTSSGDGLAVSSTPLSEAEEADLLLMREEEKLARDVYLVLYEEWGVEEFNTIAASESRHMASVANLLDRYGLDDPVATDEPGVFVNPDLQAAYDALVAQGLQSVEEAYKVGVAIEELDIEDLDRVISETTHRDIERVMSNLLRGSQNHLASFSSLISE